MNILDLFHKGGPAMWPLLFLSILSLSVIFERLWFWLRIFSQEKEIVTRILDAARDNWEIAIDIAQQAIDQPIGRSYTRLYDSAKLSRKHFDLL